MIQLERVVVCSLPLFLIFLDFSIFRLELALGKIIQVMKKNIEFSIFILKCAFHQLPWKHCVTRFLDRLTPLASGCESSWAHYTTWIQVLGRQLPGEVEARPPPPGAYDGSFSFIPHAYFRYFSYKVSASRSPGQCHIIRNYTASWGFCASYALSHGRDLSLPAVNQREQCCKFIATHADSNNTDG